MGPDLAGVRMAAWWRTVGQALGVGLAALVLSAGARAAEPAMRTQTASPEFDRLFALAQAELEQDKVDAITDWSFNDQKPFPCVCFETGEKWHYVWTRDLSYAADLALARLEPERTKTSLRFKLGTVRTPGVPRGTMVAQDTGSGGSWPISTDRVVWFLAARHLLDDPVFKREVRDALHLTLAMDDRYAFDPAMGLYRGETSFLDWREQNYPAWTAKDTTWIAESFALSTNVLHYEALRLAADLEDDKALALQRAAQADALRVAIDRRFWNEDRGMYRSYVGPSYAPVPVESYDLLGTSLAILAGVAPAERARQALSNYPVDALGSPVIWPQQPATPIYHNRAMWPFVSAYALRAARATDDAERIAFEIRSLMRGAAKAGSNMENFELTTQSVHVDDGPLSGPVVNSPRQLWSVAGYLDMVLRGVFGVEEGEGGATKVVPKLPVQWVPDLFGDRETIALAMPGQRVVLRRPKSLHGGGGLLVSGAQHRNGDEIVVDLVQAETSAQKLHRNGAALAPQTPEAPKPVRADDHWKLSVSAGTVLYVDGTRGTPFEKDADAYYPDRGVERCFTATRIDANGIESLPSRTTCVGPSQTLTGAWPREWAAPHAGRYRASVRYRNANGPINTGITAGVMRLMCDDSDLGAIVLPHNEADTASTSLSFEARAGQRCAFRLERGTNMSDLDHFDHYTGGKGGASGPLNAADVGTLTIVPIP